MRLIISLMIPGKIQLKGWVYKVLKRVGVNLVIRVKGDVWVRYGKFSGCLKKVCSGIEKFFGGVRFVIRRRQ
ncbi:MAG: hypothetical protein ABIL39_08260 [candidate division WOR-3 bacterium]